MKRKTVILVLASLALGLILGRIFLAPSAPRHDANENTAVSTAAKAQIWTCSMHPQIRKPQPGQCPLCGMDLIPVSTGASEADEGPREIVLSKNARKLAEVETTPVVRRFADVDIRLVGKIRFDETRLASIVSRVPGRIDRLYANVTGTRVNRGEHLADLYSPELISAQQELLQAIQASGEAGASGLTSSLVAATREKLRLWGFSTEQIAEIETSRKIKDHLTFLAPIGGIVIEKEALEGMSVETGMRLFSLADLSAVWVTLDAYESDLMRLRYGQQVDFEVEAYPGETFHGTIAFIDPVLDAMTRTVKVRVNAANPEGRLKPEMFVRAVVHARVAEGGIVSVPDLEGKWSCTMHPEVIADQPGPCPVCEMPLVPIREVVNGDARASIEPPLLIPASAPLITGTRAIVYVAQPGDEGRFEGREIVLGPRAGDFYVVNEGLEEGELVVTRGSFKIDSSLQIQGKASMMGEGGQPVSGHEHGAAKPAAAAKKAPEEAVSLTEPVKMQMKQFVDRLAGLADALASDDFDKAQKAAQNVKAVMAQVDMGLLPQTIHEPWMNVLPGMNELVQAPDLARMRERFAPFSEAARPLIRALGAENIGPAYVLRCPMAFDNKGAVWVYRTEDVRNPYFGAAMLRCGSTVEALGDKSEEHRHE
ncbi:MAG TPA: efflux transporter periplasmic adaptor subunit [Verrucomicrobia bacterium]|nr:MAG: hypothetical protein A2X46_00630 [Lentisphaerae bacterium GWF2_57_35]HBA82886.1 efflux transporter periplasmic adaptor subunit [Verrucomicrobiota bacterium]